jgi:antitoxin HicB
MTRGSPHIGSTLDEWLDSEGLREEATTAAIKAVLAFQLAQAMKARRLSKTAMAARMNTSRAQLDRLLDPDNTSVTLETLQRAARVVGLNVRLELV